jgi:hypothetical protein
MIRIALHLAVAVFLMVGHLSAANVYRCIARDGALAYQDHPCGNGMQQQQIHLPDTPVPDVATMPEDPAPTEPALAPSPPIAQAPRIPPPSFFLCTRYDGSRYLSESGVGSRSAVPYAVLAGSGQSLAQAYGGPNGIGVSAPGLHTPPTIPAAQAPLAGAYVWVEDTCHHAGPREVCAYLREQLDDVEQKLKRAFSDTEGELKNEQAALRARMQGC